jgi:hypothetical protein
MQERFWYAFAQMKHHELYYRKYYERSMWMDRIILTIVLLASAAGLISWLQEMLPVWACSSLIVIGQGLSITSHLLPYKSQNVALKLMLPEMGLLLLEVEYAWNSSRINDYCAEHINDVLLHYEREFKKLQNRFTNEDFIVNKGCNVAADKETVAYFNRKNYTDDESEQ